MQIHYTIGYADIYEPYLTKRTVEQQTVKKLGQRTIEYGFYPGGIVFNSIVTAENFLIARAWIGYRVYQLKTNRSNIYQNPDSLTWHLIEDCPLQRIGL